jgi:flagellar assembly protein FliH
MSKVINAHNRDHFTIKPYIFSSTDNQSVDEDDDYGDIEPLSKSLGYVFNESGEEDVAASSHERHVPNEAPSVVSAPSDGGEEVASNETVELLYKKIEELSDQVVRLEMAIEGKDAENAERVAETKASAYEEGYGKGLAEEKEAFAAQLEEKQKMVNNAITKLDGVANEYAKKLGDIESDLVSTALAIASEVIKVELSKKSSEIAVAISAELIAKLKEASTIVIKANPVNAAALGEALSENSKVKIEADDAISKGGVIVLSSIGNLDGNIFSRLEKIIKEASEQ